jgi:isovaleryl-CoA dehydrogenase
MWITNGCVDEDTLGDVFLIYARTGEGSGGLSMFLVEKGDEGFSLGTKIKVGVFQHSLRLDTKSIGVAL